MGADAKRKEARKRKFGTQTADARPDGGIDLEVEGGGIVEPAKKKQKQVPSSPEVSNSPPSAAEDEGGGDEKTVNDAGKNEGDDSAATQKAQRFIVFIGNLPYTATDKSIRDHFAKVHPKSIRHRTEKGSGRSKGFAFLEFEGYDRMKTCLKLFHQIDFDDGVSPARKLNVELTVGGGGGKSKDRKVKLRTKNERLNEQRKRRLEEEAKQGKNTKDAPAPKKGAKKGLEPKPALPLEEPVDNGDIHPSRRSRVAAR